MLGSSLPDGYRALARELIDAVLPTLADLRSLRAQAYVILAWGHLWSAEVEDIEPLENVAWSAAQRLVECYHRAVRPDWQWFESRMTYANAVLPHALFIAAERWPKEDFLDVAEASFAFLDRETTAEERLLAGRERAIGIPTERKRRRTISSRSRPSRWPTPRWPRLACWATRNTWPPSAALTAGSTARTACTSRWSMSAAAPAATACNASGVNRNQGAESTLAYLAAELHNIELPDVLADCRKAACRHVTGAMAMQAHAVYRHPTLYAANDARYDSLLRWIARS